MVVINKMIRFRGPKYLLFEIVLFVQVQGLYIDVSETIFEHFLTAFKQICNN